MRFIEYPNVFVNKCEDCDGFGHTFAETSCPLCNGRGFLYTELGEQLVELLNELGVL